MNQPINKSAQPFSTQNPQKIAIIGCANMGSAIAERLSSHHQIILYDHNPEKATKLVNNAFGTTTTSLEEALEKADIVILAIKPQNLKQSAPSIQEFLKDKHTLISLLTSITLLQLKEFFPISQIVRMMPNTPLLCGEGMIAFCSQEREPFYTKDQLSTLFAPLGKLLWLNENKIDAFTALAGSGPAFIFAMIEAIVESGIAMGFPATEAQAIACQMIKGSAALLESSEKHPAELKWQVTSPGGTTIEGLKTFEDHAVIPKCVQILVFGKETAPGIKRS